MASKIYISDCCHGSYLGDINDSNTNIPPNDRYVSAKPVKLKMMYGWVSLFQFYLELLSVKEQL